MDLVRSLSKSFFHSSINFLRYLQFPEGFGIMCWLPTVWDWILSTNWTLHCNKLYNSLSLWHRVNSTKLIEKYQYTSGPVGSNAIVQGSTAVLQRKIANCVLDISEDKIKGTMAVTEGH